MPSRIVKVEVSKRGPQGAIDPQDRARFDRAVEVAEAVDAVVETVTQAEDSAVQASEAAQQAAQTAAQDAAAAVAPAAADAIRAQVAADADRAEQAAEALPEEVAARTAVTGTLARVHEGGRFARSGVEYAEVGAGRARILHHEDGVRVYDMPLRAEGDFTGSMVGEVNGSSAPDDPDRWARSGVAAAIVGNNRRAIQSAQFVQMIESPERWARSGSDAVIVGRNRRMVIDLSAAGEPEPAPPPAPPTFVPWSDGTHVYADRQDTGESVRVSQGGGANTNPRLQEGVVIWHSDRPAVSTYEPAAPGGLYFSPPDWADEHPVIPLQWLCCLGDSTTAGGYMGQFSGLGWSIPFRNLGRAGNTASGIAARYWAVEVSYDCPQIPGNTTEVICAPSATSEAWPGEIIGGASAAISGWLVSDPSAHPSTGVYVEVRWDSAGGVYYIRRREAGDPLAAGKWYFFASPTTATDGNSAPSSALQAWKFQDAILLCLIGRNSAGEPDHVFDMARRIWSAHKPLSKRIVMMPWMHGTNEPRGSSGYANRARALALFHAEWPDNTLDLVPWLQAKATDSAADQTALANDTPPPSLMDDSIHPGPAGRVEMARGIMDFCTRKGWR